MAARMGVYSGIYWGHQMSPDGHMNMAVFGWRFLIRVSADEYEDKHEGLSCEWESGVD
jgi:hypothetical protein